MSMSSKTRPNSFYGKDFGIKFAPYQENPTTNSILTALWKDAGPLTDVPTIDPTSEFEAAKSATYEHSSMMKKREGKVDFSIQQIYPDDLVEMYCGLISKEDVAGSPVTNFDQDIAIGSLSKGNFQPFTQQNYAGGVLTVPATIVITEDPAGTPRVLVIDTDYQVCLIDGVYGIVPTNSGSFDNTKLARMRYDYTPRAKTRLFKTEMNTIGKIMLMAFKKIPGETGSNNKYIEVYFPRCEPVKDFGIKGQARDSSDWNDIPMSYSVKFHDNYKKDGKKILEFAEFYEAS